MLELHTLASKFWSPGTLEAQDLASKLWKFRIPQLEDFASEFWGHETSEPRNLPAKPWSSRILGHCLGHLSLETVDHKIIHHEPHGVMNAGITDHAFVIYEKH